MKILVVDDVGYIRHFLTRLLQQAGHMAVSAGSGLEAVKILKSDHSIELVVTDLMMADMDGVDLFQAVHRLERVNDAGPVAPPKFVLLTALHPKRNAQQRDVERLQLAKEIGFEGVLFKPVEQQELLGLLKNMNTLVEKPPKADLKNVKEAVNQTVAELIARGNPSEMDEFLDWIELTLSRLRTASLETASA